MDTPTDKSGSLYERGELVHENIIFEIWNIFYVLYGL